MSTENLSNGSSAKLRDRNLNASPYLHNICMSGESIKGPLQTIE
jgi:hypothetical protein